MSKSLADSVALVPNALELATAEPYKPENIVIGEYAFLPYVRTGVAAGLTKPRGPVRAELDASVDVEAEIGAPIRVSKKLTVRGPGDVLGFDARQIIRRYPVPGTPNAEDTFFAHVEFDRPDFPWLFTPFAPEGDKLAPWIALVVVEARHAVIRPGGPALVQTVTTRRREVGSLTDSWAWAHAQVVGAEKSGPALATRLSGAFGDVNLSRLVCPRVLEPTKSYIACIVPAFDAGVRAALGAGGGTTAAAWTRVEGDDDQEITLPVFDHWTFSTTTDGDFASLAGKLVGLPAPWNVGRRVIDASRPGGDIAELGLDDPGRLQIIRCALTAPSTAKKPDGVPDDAETWDDAKTAEIQAQLNLPEQLSGDPHFDGNVDLPIVGPRIYARFQRGSNLVNRAAQNDWFNELNLVPTNRVVAGLGTRVVQQDREQLMQAAWAKVGPIEAVNAKIRLAQAARFAGDSLHSRHFSALSVGHLTQLTRGLQAKVRLGAAMLTIYGTAARSAAASPAFTPAFRRATRARGPLARYTEAGGRAALDRLVATGTTIRDFRRAYVEPDGVVTLSAKALGGLSAANAARVLGVDAGLALAQVAARTARFAALPSAVDHLLAPVATWRPRAAALDLGGRVAITLLELLHAAMPSKITAQPSRGETLGTLFEGLASSRTPAAASARESLHNIGTRLPVRLPAVAAPVGPIVRQGIAVAPQRFQTAASLQLATTIAASRNVPSEVLLPALADFARGIGAADLPLTPGRPPLVVQRQTLLDAIHPRATATAHIRARLGGGPAWMPPTWFDDGMVRPIMYAPAIEVPMYERLDAYDRDWLVPGLSKIPQNDFVTLLETNPKFTESFLAGLSDEMGRELLWRGFPTDQRGTYFRRFWNAYSDELAQDLHRFTETPLGTHLHDAAGNTGRIVLVIRGELMKRYPDAITLALRAIEPVAGHPAFADPSSQAPKPIAPVLFHAFLPPDILLVGFDLVDAELVPNRWWFVIAEHPTAPRFGILDHQPPPLGANAGVVARDFLREPVRAAFEASRLLAPAKAGG
jgi:hypothetical protein